MLLSCTFKMRIKWNNQICQGSFFEHAFCTVWWTLMWQIILDTEKKHLSIKITTQSTHLNNFLSSLHAYVISNNNLPAAQTLTWLLHTGDFWLWARTKVKSTKHARSSDLMARFCCEGRMPCRLLFVDGGNFSRLLNRHMTFAPLNKTTVPDTALTFTRS
jgi:hypothetical protein